MINVKLSTMITLIIGSAIGGLITSNYEFTIAMAISFLVLVMVTKFSEFIHDKVIKND